MTDHVGRSPEGVGTPTDRPIAFLVIVHELRFGQRGTYRYVYLNRDEAEFEADRKAENTGGPAEIIPLAAVQHERAPSDEPKCWLCDGDGKWRPAACGICGVLDGDADVRVYVGERGDVMRCPLHRTIRTQGMPHASETPSPVTGTEAK